jgi:streptogramin lyase
LGKKDQPSDTGWVPKPGFKGLEGLNLESIKRGGPPFNRPTGVAVSSSGEIYVADGYGNARVHKFTPDGSLLFSWGEPGHAPGQFWLPHSVWVDKQERVWICDRQANRIQIFDSKGEFLDQWTNLLLPANLVIDEKEEIVYVAEISRRVSIFTIEGKLLARWGEGTYIHQRSTNGQEEDPPPLFLAPHGITVDSRGDIYVGDIAWGVGGVDRGPKTVQKFARKI